MTVINRGRGRRALIGVLASLAIGILSGAASADGKDRANHSKMDRGNVEKKAGQKVEMKVTEKGFEPENLTVKKGQPVTLVITRTTDKTCATEIVIDEYGIKTTLPLNEAVEVSFTPKKAGKLTYGCAMGKMIGGVLTVQ
jgi:plastocyanin domain-containing protein